LGAYRIVAAAELDVRHVGEAHDLAVRAGLEHDVAELLVERSRPCALIAIRKSAPPLIGSAPSWPPRLQILLLDRAHDVASGEAARGDPVGSSQTRIA